MRGAVLIALAACAPPPARDSSAAGLAAYLTQVAAMAPDARAAEIAGWRLDRAAWDRAIAPRYRDLYEAYVAAFAAEAPAIALSGPITARDHFAGDPRLTAAEARIRWVLPVLAPTRVADHAGEAIDAVFVADRGAWRALIGLDTALTGRIAAHAPACAARITAAAPLGRCGEAGAAVADAALRIAGAGSSPELDHACRLADALCGKPSP